MEDGSSLTFGVDGNKGTDPRFSLTLLNIEVVFWHFSEWLIAVIRRIQVDVWSDEYNPSRDVSWCMTLARLHRPPSFSCRTTGFQETF